MGFNNGLERVRLENRWKKLRVQYRAAGMSEEAIQAMYEFDLDVLNNEHAYVDNTVTVVPSHDDDTGNGASFKQYEDAITRTDTYHETKTRFAWIGEMEEIRFPHLHGLQRQRAQGRSADEVLKHIFSARGICKLRMSLGYILTSCEVLNFGSWK